MIAVHHNGGIAIVTVGAQLSVPELRRATRHPVDYSVIAEHRERGDVPMHVVNISAQGFMIDNVGTLARGDRVLIRLPHVGHIEAYCMWTMDVRAGFQFERLLRQDIFTAVIEQLQPNTMLRRAR